MFIRRTSMNLINGSKKTMKLILEPWAREYKIRPDETVQILARGKNESLIEVEYNDDGNLTVYGWSDDMRIMRDGEELEPFAD